MRGGTFEEELLEVIRYRVMHVMLRSNVVPNRTCDGIEREMSLGGELNVERPMVLWTTKDGFRIYESIDLVGYTPVRFIVTRSTFCATTPKSIHVHWY